MMRIKTLLAVAVTVSLMLAVGCSDDQPAGQTGDGGGKTTPKPTPTTKPAPTPTTKPAPTPTPTPTPAPTPAPTTAPAGNPVVIIETSMGTITAELWADKAPITVKNFLRYTDEKFFDGLIGHRVLKGFMIQGGGYDAAMQPKSGHDPITNEAATGTPNDRGTLAMARTNVVDSATAQFFINLVDNDFLNHSSKTVQGFGYCAFGKVTEGMDVVDKIGAVPVKFNNNPRPEKSEPIKPVLIKSIRRAP